jgi:hypothetical protein
MENFMKFISKAAKVLYYVTWFFLIMTAANLIASYFGHGTMLGFLGMIPILFSPILLFGFLLTKKQPKIGWLFLIVIANLIYTINFSTDKIHKYELKDDGKYYYFRTEKEISKEERKNSHQAEVRLFASAFLFFQAFFLYNLPQLFKEEKGTEIENDKNKV